MKATAAGTAGPYLLSNEAKHQREQVCDNQLGNKSLLSLTLARLYKMIWEV